MNDPKLIPSRLLVCQENLTKLLSRISEIENNLELPSNMKISSLKIIREEIINVKQEIDNIKKEINLLTNYQVN